MHTILQRDSTRLLIILFLSFVVTVIGNAFHPDKMPFLLGKGKRPAVPIGRWEENLTYIGIGEVSARASSGQATLIDLRGAEEFEEAHAAGAVNLPYEEYRDLLDDFFDEVSTDEELIFFCEGVNCGKSERVAKLFLDEEYANVAVWKHGFEKWKALNLPIE